MKSFRRLRFFRIAVAAAVLIAFGILFTDQLNMPVPLARGQFLPELLMLFAGVTVAAAIAVGVLALLSFFLGRVYCSFLCPLGILQDFAGFLGGLVKRKKFRFTPDRKALRYGVLLFVISAALYGWMLPLATVEPFAFFGRIGNSLIRPAAVWVNHYCWEKLRWDITPLEYHPVEMSGVWIAAATLLLLLIAVLWRGRIFCNTLCPTGALLGLLAAHSPRRLRIDQDKCRKCRKCIAVCKSSCISDGGEIRIGNERCVSCFNCGAVCPFDAIAFGKEPAAEAPVSPERRDFIIGGTTAAIAGIGAGLLHRRQDAPAAMPVMPPGADNFARFNAKCTACGLCIANCPGKTLKSAGFEYGFSGIGQPRLEFSIGKCEYECTRCSNLCPNGALTPQQLEAKQHLRVGMVEFHRAKCIVVIDEEDCGACAEHCPTGALQMVPYKGTLTVPKVIPELCIGCGSCEYICPARPKAMLIHGLAKQEKAASTADVLKPAADQPKAKAAPTGDFPF